MESLRYLLGADLNSVEWMRHWRSGEEEHDGASPPAERSGSFLPAAGEYTEELETVSHEEQPSSEQGDGGWSMTRTSGENRSGPLRFCSQPRLVRLPSVAAVGLDSRRYFLCTADDKGVWWAMVASAAAGDSSGQLGAPPLFSPKIACVMLQNEKEQWF